MDAPFDVLPDPAICEALRLVAAGCDPAPALDAYLVGLSNRWSLDEAGLLAVGADGRARVRAWAGSQLPDDSCFDAGWLRHGEIDPLVLAQLGLRRVALWPAGPGALLLLGHRDDAPLPAPCGDPLLTTLLLAESAHATHRAAGVLAGICAADDERSVWRAVDAGLSERFSAGVPVEVPVAGTSSSVAAAVATPADAEAVQLVADVAAIALGRCDGALAEG